jgi:hypothetical protein
MTSYRRRTILERDQAIPSGKEFHSNGIPVEPGEFVTLTAHASQPFYAGLYTREEYFSKGGPGTKEFPFQFGTDRVAFTSRRGVGNMPDDLFVVIRVGVFAGSTRVHLKLEKMTPIVEDE